MHQLPKEHWTPEFHGEDDEDENSAIHSEREDGILEDYLDDEYSDDEAPKLKPKQFKEIDIPTEKAIPAHDHLIVEKEPVKTHMPEYGKAYEMDRKKAIRGDKESVGLAPK